MIARVGPGSGADYLATKTCDCQFLPEGYAQLGEPVGDQLGRLDLAEARFGMTEYGGRRPHDIVGVRVNLLHHPSLQLLTRGHRTLLDRNKSVDSSRGRLNSNLREAEPRHCVE